MLAKNLLRGPRLTRHLRESQEKRLRQSSAAHGVDADRLLFRGPLQNHRVQILNPPCEFGPSAQHFVELLDLLVQRGGALKVQLLAGFFPLRFESGPQRPAAFIKWTQTILFRQAYAYLHTRRSDRSISLDEQKENFGEQLIDARNPDPQETVLQRELHAELKNAILSLKNQKYQHVLLCTFLEGMEERELASLLKVQIQDIYLWRCRALKTLGSKQEVREALQPWLRG